MSIYIGIDNGVTGSIGIIYMTEGEEPAMGSYVAYHKMPVIRQLNYTKVKHYIHRVDHDKLWDILMNATANIPRKKVFIERPMVNPKRFRATASALRALEAVLGCVESMKIPYQYIDSKEWQSELLPKGVKGDELKSASLDIAKRLFPTIDFKGFRDGDGLLIAEHCRRSEVKNDKKKKTR